MSEITIRMGPCWFCGEAIAEQGVDPSRVTVETQQGKWQVWY